MDLVLGGYGRACISDMSEEELLEFEALLEMNDQELLKMFMTGEGMPLSLLRVREYWEGCGEG
jgi:succinate dehydrogenase flavin-adding protein (antitoxin of CptAB toxin-antitoxin module)